MRINELSLSGFRNYHRQSLTFDPDCNVIYGENAQGKTNLLEAVVYLSCGKSPRTHADRELIGFDAPGAVLEGRILSRDRDFVTRIELNRGKKRKMTVNGVAAKSAAALSDVLHTVFFAPEDLFLIRDGAAARRKFMDLSLCQLRPRYAEALAEYSRLYEHKTRILRDSEDFPGLLDTLPEFNHRLIQVGAVLIRYRASFCEKLRQYAAQAHAARSCPCSIRPSKPSPIRWWMLRCWRSSWRSISRATTPPRSRRACVSAALTRTISRCPSTATAPGSSAHRGRCGRRRWP